MATSVTDKPFTMFAVVAVIYLAFTTVLTRELPWARGAGEPAPGTMSFDLPLVWESLPRLSEGLGLTVQLLLGSLFIGMLLAAPTTWALDTRRPGAQGRGARLRVDVPRHAGSRPALRDLLRPRPVRLASRDTRLGAAPGSLLVLRDRILAQLRRLHRRDSAGRNFRHSRRPHRRRSLARAAASGDLPHRGLAAGVASRPAPLRQRGDRHAEDYRACEHGDDGGDYRRGGDHRGRDLRPLRSVPLRSRSST